MATKTAPKKNRSALKRVRQAKKRQLRNQSAKTRIKTQISKLNTALANNDKENIDSIFRETVKIISSAASKNIIHKNTASRKISRLAKKVAAFKAKESLSASNYTEAS
ncbi:MAG: 30S ribosomal protein S20 [Thermodesulfovibrionales bacterium]|nr:30S ribosomal protein S20 [Thermodesulfovibrionales bacterium]